MKTTKRVLAITAPFLLTTPAFSKDILYLRCNVTSDLLIADLTTSKVAEDRTIEDIAILKIDLKASTAHDARSEQAIDIAIKGKTALITQRINDDEIKLDDDGELHLSPPYSFSGSGKGVYKSKNQKVDYIYKGSCIKTDPEAFHESFNQ